MPVSKMRSCRFFEGAQIGQKTPRALAGRLRRAQTFLRALGIEIASCPRRANRHPDHHDPCGSAKRPPGQSRATVRTVCTVCAEGLRTEQP